VDDMNEPLASGRSMNELFDATMHRTHIIRRRRLAVRTAIPAALIVVLALGAGLAWPTDGDTPVKVADSGTTTTTEPPTTTTSPEPTTTTTTAPVAAAPRASTTSTTAAGPTTTTTAARPPSCATEDLVFSVTTDQAGYSKGSRINVRAVARNTSQRSCYDPSVSGYELLDGDGKPVWEVMIASSITPDAKEDPLDPNESREFVFDMTAENCHDGGCDPLPADYSVRVRWGRAASAESPKFTVR